MILQDLINRVTVYSANGEELPPPIAGELLSACVSLKNKNAELHKELAKLKDERVFVVNGG
ncbi:hypothetical protein [Pseudoalteromonas phage H103]|uniref:hypothetical protein n=1 Tax=Pseudoalteromonas phage H103 TaxID=1636200 RepID=UPI0006BCEDDA|nr:hypothetical protein AVU31_gp73 [Pseudoalteromonas phage H103]AKA61249.1 hypothetical protein [Pseudoalteromonas phage H103]